MSSSDKELAKEINLPSRLPQPTGNILYDSLQSALHVTDLPCARNALMAGIGGGIGMGAIRGIVAGPMMAGHWAIGTFAFVSLSSWHLCQKKYADERRGLKQVIESMPKRTIKEVDDNSLSSNP